MPNFGWFKFMSTLNVRRPKWKANYFRFLSLPRRRINCGAHVNNDNRSHICVWSLCITQMEVFPSRDLVQLPRNDLDDISNVLWLNCLNLARDAFCARKINEKDQDLLLDSFFAWSRSLSRQALKRSSNKRAHRLAGFAAVVPKMRGEKTLLLRWLTLWLINWIKSSVWLLWLPFISWQRTEKCVQNPTTSTWLLHPLNSSYASLEHSNHRHKFCVYWFTCVRTLFPYLQSETAGTNQDPCWPKIHTQGKA